MHRDLRATYQPRQWIWIFVLVHYKAVSTRTKEVKKIEEIVDIRIRKSLALVNAKTHHKIRQGSLEAFLQWKSRLDSTG